MSGDCGFESRAERSRRKLHFTGIAFHPRSLSCRDEQRRDREALRHTPGGREDVHLGSARCGASRSRRMARSRPRARHRQGRGLGCGRVAMRVLQAKTKRPLDVLAVARADRRGRVVGVRRRRDVEVWRVATDESSSHSPVGGADADSWCSRRAASTCLWEKNILSRCTTSGRPSGRRSGFTPPIPEAAVSADGTRLLIAAVRSRHATPSRWVRGSDSFGG